MDIKDIRFLAKGKRSKVYTGTLNNKKIAIKHTNKAEIESYWLKLVNKQSIGPKYISNNEEILVCEFITGVNIIDFIKKANKKDILNVLINVMRQCRSLDKLKINKLEMHNPYKHVIINNKVTLIDFERCYKTDNPKNVTQFGQFIMSGKVSKILDDKNIFIDKKKFTEILKKYKWSYKKGYFKRLLDFLKV